MTRLTTATRGGRLSTRRNFMSASGGGDPVVERGQLLADLEAGREIGWVPLSTFAPMMCCSAPAIRALSPRRCSTTRPKRPPRLEAPWFTTIPSWRRWPCSSVSSASTCRGLISVEIGGINAGAILSAAARLGLPLADADYAGRAIPELHATALELFGAPVLPFACADYYGNETVILGAASNAWAERIGKHLAQASLGIVGCAFAALPVARAAEIAVPGTLSEALQLGRAIREAPAIRCRRPPRRSTAGCSSAAP